jgi:hypothetical protein
MEREVTSRRLHHASELMLLIPVRKGFVEGVAPLTSYASRLRRLLESLSDVRRLNLEQHRLWTADPIDSLRSIYVTQWAVLERPGSPQLMVCSSFDRSWEDYFHLLVDRTGPLLDAIFCHCEDYAGHTCEDGFERFTRWIRRWQQPCNFFYVAAPDMTVDDLRHARKHLAGVGDSKLPLDSLEAEAQRTKAQRHRELALQMGRPVDDIRKDADKGLRAVLSGYYEMGKLFPETEKLEREGQAGQRARTAQRIFNEAMALLFKRALAEKEALAGLQPDVAAWVGALQSLRGESAGDGPDRAGETAEQAKAPSALKLTGSDLQDIQSNILFPHVTDKEPPLTHGCVVLVQCDDAKSLRSLLGRLQPYVSTQRPRPDAALLNTPAGDRVYVNLALSYAGLSRLELGDEVMSLLPKEFKEGMAARASLYGDLGYPNHPAFWQLPEVNWPDTSLGERVELSTVDVVLVLMTRLALGDHTTWSKDHPLRNTLRDMQVECEGARILHVQALYREGEGGHFGLLEGPRVSSQPVPDVTLEGDGVNVEGPGRDRVPLGELLLGYPDRRGQVAECAQQHQDLFHNGTFLVMRKLEQDVRAFRSFVARTAEATGTTAQKVRGWILGRDDEGTPLTPKAPRAALNDFDYQQDPGIHCPFHAHIRLANPRDPEEPAPRIMRRGFSYGPPYDPARAEPEQGAEPSRGLMFMAYNASIASQFEVVQRWLNGGNSTGLPSTQNDILVGAPQPSAVRWVIDGGSFKPVLPPERPLVSLRWGLYLFVPSRSALEKLAETPEGAQQAREARLARHGKRLVDELNAIPDVNDARTAWKQALEEDARSAEAIWAYVRRCEQPVRAQGYGLLVGKLKAARQVLSQTATYSVREYGKRFSDTMFPHYLGLDPGSSYEALGSAARLGEALGSPNACGAPGVLRKSYEELSNRPNAYLKGLGPTPSVFAVAQDITLRLLKNVPPLPGSAPPRFALDLRPLVMGAVAGLAQQYLGMPDPRALRETLEEAIILSRYCFQPYPDEVLDAQARQLGPAFWKRYKSWEPAGPMAEKLRGEGLSDDEIRLAIAGALVGFAPPAVAGLLGVLLGWLEQGEFWRLQMRCRRLLHASRGDAAHVSKVEQVVSRALLESLFRRPVPPLLYRTLHDARPADGEAGQEPKVIVGLQSVMQEARDAGDPTAHQWLFGGEPGSENSVHGCPAREPALKMLAGIAYALLTCRDLRQEKSVLVTFAGLDS